MSCRCFSGSTAVDVTAIPCSILASRSSLMGKKMYWNSLASRTTTLQVALRRSLHFISDGCTTGGGIPEEVLADEEAG